MHKRLAEPPHFFDDTQMRNGFADFADLTFCGQAGAIHDGHAVTGFVVQDTNEMRVLITRKRDGVGSKIFRRSVEKFATRHWGFYQFDNFHIFQGSGGAEAFAFSSMATMGPKDLTLSARRKIASNFFGSLMA